MTREHKLSLILGFAVVLVVGVLLSDHLSDARRVTLEQTNPADQVVLDAPSAAPTKTPTLVLVDPQGRPIEPAPIRPASDSGSLSDQLADAGDASTPDSLSAEEELLNTTMFRPVNRPAGQGNPIAAIGDEFAGAVKGLINGEAPIPAAQLDQAPPTLVMRGRAPESASPTVPPTGAPTTAPTTAPTRPSRLYTIVGGDSLWGIASRELGDGFRYKEIAELNRDRIGPSGQLRVGASLRLPADALSTPASRSGVASEKPTPAKPKPTSKPATTYTVRSGDTLGEIALKTLGTSKRYREILEANLDQLDDADSVRAGMVLTIPAR